VELRRASIFKKVDMEKSFKKYRVLIVDDSERLLELFERMLDGEEFEVETRCGAEKGLEFIQADNQVSLVIASHCEQKGLNGLSLLSQVSTLSANTIKFLTTCCLDSVELENKKKAGDIHLYSKLPFRVDEMRDQIRSGLKLYEANTKHLFFKVGSQTEKLKILIYDKEKEIRNAVEQVIAESSEFLFDVVKVNTENKLIEVNGKFKPDWIITDFEPTDCQNCFLYSVRKSEAPSVKKNLVIFGNKMLFPCSDCNISREERDDMCDFFFDKSTEFHKIGELFKNPEK
jgi:DNA-binding NtrC family response regulator